MAEDKFRKKLGGGGGKYFFLHDGVSVLLPNDEDELESLALIVEPPDTACPPLSESAPEGP